MSLSTFVVAFALIFGVAGVGYYSGKLGQKMTDKIPSMSRSMFWLGLFSWILLYNFVGLFVPGDFLTNLSLVIFAASMIRYMLKVAIPARIEMRNEWRYQRWQAWLKTEIKPLEPAADWDEIERATGELLIEGKEPTFERAETFIRKEQEAKKHRERVKEIERCGHDSTEKFDTDYGYKIICADCGGLMSTHRNPFKRPVTR